MALREDIVIRSSPVRVWEVLGDPSLMTLWNPKCVKCECRQSPVRIGLRYKAAFRMKGPEQELWCEVIDCVPMQLLKTRYTGEAFRNGGYVEEVFQLVPSSMDTRLVHAMDFSHSGLPWLLRLLMKVVSVFGYSVGRSSLEGIKELVEESEAGQPSHRRS